MDGFPVLTLPERELVSSGCWTLVPLQGDGRDGKINLCLPPSHPPEGHRLLGHSYDTAERASDILLVQRFRERGGRRWAGSGMVLGKPSPELAPGAGR